ncbi:MAG: hypothetical protein GY713_18840 [Actinomycetia bacterium]|nr:hypothetical protein [Actinomycetes bacterium]
MADHIYLDHLAVASEHGFEQFARYYGELGGEFIGGAVDPGFFFFQVKYVSGMKIEILEDDPGQPAEDFLRRFVDRNSAGPHHLTFKVPDIHAALDRVRDAGYEPVGIDVVNPEWQQAFLHPKQAPGIVIQMAASNKEGDGWDLGDTHLPQPICAAPADLERVVLLVDDLDRETRLFSEVFNGERVGEGTDDELGGYVELVWSSGGRLRLVNPTNPAVVQWLGGRAGRLYSADFVVADIGPVTGARTMGAGRWEVPPEANLGVRLRLRGPGGSS